MSYYKSYLDQLKQNEDEVTDFVTKASSYFDTLRVKLSTALGCADEQLVLELPQETVGDEQKLGAVTVLGSKGVRTMFVLKVPGDEIGLSVLLMPFRHTGVAIFALGKTYEHGQLSAWVNAMMETYQAELDNLNVKAKLAAAIRSAKRG
jgi:hypothetical protein